MNANAIECRPATEPKIIGDQAVVRSFGLRGARLTRAAEDYVVPLDVESRAPRDISDRPFEPLVRENASTLPQSPQTRWW